MFAVFVIGVSSGVIENFAYKRLREVGGEGTVMGVSRFFSSVTGVPMFWYSGACVRAAEQIKGWQSIQSTTDARNDRPTDRPTAPDCSHQTDPPRPTTHQTQPPHPGHVTKRLSVIGVLILSMCSYILRFLIYASIRNPWQGLPAEALRGFTFAAMWASSTYYTHRISPPGLSATMVWEDAFQSAQPHARPCVRTSSASAFCPG